MLANAKVISHEQQMLHDKVTLKAGGTLLLHFLRETCCLHKFTLQRVQIFEPTIPQESEAIVFSSTLPWATAYS